MIKTDTNKMVLEKVQQILSSEELDFDLPVPEITTEEYQDELDLGQIVQNSDVLLEVITEQGRSKRIWQIATVSLTIFVAIISFICLGLYLERQNHIERFSRAQANIHKATNDFTQTSQKAKTLENQLAKSNEEIKHIQNELTNSKAEIKRAHGDLKNSRSEVKNLQTKLNDATQQLKELQNRNVEAVKRLNQRLNKLND